MVLSLLFTGYFALAQTPPCPAPANCGSNPQYFCGEVTEFNWTMIPDGQGLFRIIVRGIAASNVQTTYYLVSVNTGNVVATLNGAQGVFEDVPYDCYRIVICTDGDIDYYCCKELPCEHIDFSCCELRFPFYTDLPNPTWQFGDNTTSTMQNVIHEYTNLNTYPNEGTPQATVQLSWGASTLQSVVQFPAGIWVGQDCQDAGNSSALMNSVNPSLQVFPALTYQTRKISIKGSLTMNQNYQFTDCDFCMNPASRIVSVAKPLSFLTNTHLHEDACKDEAWYGVELRQGALTAQGATFAGAYNALYTQAGVTSSPVFQVADCSFNRNYLGVRISSPTTFSAFRGNTLGLAAEVAPWPGLEAGACPWVNFINKPVDQIPFAGVYAETPAGAAPVSLIMPKNTLSSTVPNTFINLSSGIYLRDANATVLNSRFENMVTGAYPADDGFGIALFSNNSRQLLQWGLGKNTQPLTFDNCAHAIYVNMDPHFAGGNVLVRSYNNNMDVARGYTLIGGFSRFRQGSVIQNNNIQHTRYGMLVQNAAPDTRLLINRNRIDATNNSFWGINLGNFTPQPLGGDYRVSVIDNVDDATHNDGIFGAAANGVSIGNFSNVLMESNTIGGFTGIGVFNVESPENDIRCNDVFSAAGQRVLFVDNSPNMMLEYNQTDNTDIGIQITDPCNNSLISCNQIGSHDIGLFLDGTAVTGQQLPNATSAGNTWIGTYTNWAASIDLGANVAGSRFFFRNGEIDPVQIFQSNPPNDWFRMSNNGITCGTGCPQSQATEREVTDLDIQIAEDSLELDELPGYLLRRHLYNDLLYYPDLLQGNSALQNFYNSFGASNGGQLAALEKSLTDAYKLTTQQQSAWDAAQSNLNAAFDQWAVLDSLVENGADPEAQKTQREALQRQSRGADSTLQSIYSANLATRIASVDSLQDLFDGIDPQTQWETNEKAMDETYLHTAFVDVAPDSAQTARVKQIAEQCSADGGPAVHRARAWYYLLTDIRVEVECNGIMERGMQDNPVDATGQYLVIKPNPAQDYISVQFTGVFPDGSSFEIVDMSGHLKNTAALPGKENTVNIPALGLSNGNYVCRLIHNGKTLAVAKFSILR